MKILIAIILFVFCSYNALGQSIFVSNTGNDLNIGTINKPFRTIERAIKEVNSKTDSATIFLREGIYYQEKSLEFININNITLTAYPNEKVYITGGISIKKKYIRALEDNIVSSRINKKIRKSIKTINFNKLGITISDLDKRGFEYPTKAAWNEVFVNNQPLQIAQWPNNYMIKTHKVINGGNIKSKGVKGQGYPIIEYIENEPNTWENINGGWICGYFGEGWADDMLPIKSLDKKNKRITIGSSSLYGFKADGVYRRWFIKNLPEAIDLPGEYVHDATINEICFLPPQKNINKVQLSILKDPILQIKSSENVTIKTLDTTYSDSKSFSYNGGVQAYTAPYDGYY